MGKTKEEARLKKREYDRKRRERLKMNPESCLILKEKERMKYLQKKEKGQVKSVSKMTSRNLRIIRKQWRKNSHNYRLKKQAVNENDVDVPSSNEGVPGLSSEQSISLSEVQNSRKKIYKKICSKNTTKMQKKIKELEHEISVQKTRAERYKKRLFRVKHKDQNRMTPRSQVNKFLGEETVSPSVRKRLIFGEVLRLQISQKPMKLEFEASTSDLIKELESNLSKYMTRVANIAHQYQAVNDLKEKLSTDSILVHIDFREYYGCKYNEEIQSVHFRSGQQQVTIHTGVYYSKENNEVIPNPFASISPSLGHDSASILAHLKF
ncbi:hypothetical protein AVEN_193825-1 [Araneus ventricosus]|uniref:Uncharacterized protein n=1 Tax=Araneus ventricosus TaxID=182803 RepID=A0A4Y2XDB6_ARAVE|nr:hypothetical protein AVEN_193825-1 [Araneus ventricosus]